MTHYKYLGRISKIILKRRNNSLIGSIIFLIALIASSCTHPADPLFIQLPSSLTNIHFKNQLIDHDSLNILNYLYYYNGAGVAVGDINNDGLPDIYFAANSKAKNKLYLNKGNFKFEDITEKAGVQGDADWCTGVTMADVNADGWLDIYVCALSRKLGLKGHNSLYINNGDGTFTESAAKYGLDFSGYSTQAVFFDYDHDGDIDCFLLNQSSHSTETYGDTSLRKASNAFAGDKLFRNDYTTSKKFTDVTSQSGIYSSALGYGLGVAVADLNNDGWEDIYIGNDFQENDYYYINNHNGTFTESGARHFNHYSRFSMGNDIADYNNDGQLDIVTADMLPAEERFLKTYQSDESLDIYNYTILQNGFQNQYSRNCLQQNLGMGEAFSDQALLAGVSATDWSWSPLIADFDNDGIKDLFISNGIVKRPGNLDYAKFISSGLVRKQLMQSSRLDSLSISKMPDGKIHNYIFKGSSIGRFSDMSNAWGMTTSTYSNGAAYADLDNDGRLDLIVNNINDEAGIYRNNNVRDKKYLSISFKGNNGNTFGIGCKLYLFDKGKIQYQQLMLTRGFESSSDARLHFGLDTLSTIDSVLAVWPDQSYQLLKNVKTNQRIIILQKNAHGIFEYHSFFGIAKPLFIDISDSINLSWKHNEDTFLDFNHQYFIPHELSTAGPRIAIGDVNGDGLDDFYACGAKGQGGNLFTQTKNQHFAASDTALFKADAACEDVDALFFDADGDGDLDLYVVSGGNELAGNATALLDRLYFNDGRGHFTKSVNSLPPIYQNKSTVSMADIDRDGDMDLFIGVRADALSHGIPQTSYILLNDGKGNFVIANDKIADLKNIGMITTSSFADVNNDGWADLVVAGEWMPVKIFINYQGKLAGSDKEQPGGLWQSIYITDIDGDGNMDILAGNFGTNSKLHASKESPMKLYVKDFDRNMNIDQLLTYTVNHKEYTFLGKDALEKQLPGINKRFLRYDDFAGKTVQEVYGDELNDAVVSQIQTLSSGLFKNDGKGNFSFQPFPDQTQVSPIFSFEVEDINGDGIKDIISGGNLYGVTPYEGRYDASFGNILLGQQHDAYQWLSPVNSGFFINGEIRDIKQIKTANGYLYVVARNNDHLIFLKQQQH